MWQPAAVSATRSAPEVLRGRTQDLAAADRWMATDGRLLTIVGPPGVGKSRLALELMRGRPGSLSRDLTTSRTASDVERALQTALGGVSRARLGRVLALHEGLVVLDRFEHLVSSAGPLVASWIAVPGPRFVVTSREPLGISGETVLVLDALEEANAVALYVDRARRKVDLDVASAIVRKLDRLPLSIELAAARAGVLSDDDLLARLARGIGAIDGPSSSLRATIRWSIDLLSTVERDALGQCAVFRGAFDVQAAEAVLRDTGDVSAQLAALERKGLLRRVGGGATAHVALYDAVREVALDTIFADEERERVAARHAGYYVALAESVLASDRPELAVALGGKTADLAATCDALRERDPSSAAKLALAIDLAHGGLSPSSAHVELLSSAVECAHRAGDAVLQARTLHARARVHRLTGAARAAMRDLRAALRLARTAGSARVEADVLRLLGVVCRQLTRVVRARPLLERALELYEAGGMLQGAAMVHDDLGVLAHDLDNLPSARESYERALALERVVGDRRFEGITLGHLGLLANDLGDLPLAQRYYLDALDRHRECGDRRFEGFALAFLSAAQIEQNDLEAARSSLKSAAAIDARLGDVDSGALLAGLRCTVEALSGDLASAYEALARSRRDLAQRDDAALGRMLAVFAGAIDLGEARRARVEGRPADAQAHLQAVQRALSPGWPATSVEERFARRVIGRLLDASAGARPAVVVAADGSSFEGASGLVSLVTRRSLARMLERLAGEMRDAPGRAVAIESLFEAGWPGERVAAASARRRVYVGIDTLRSLGLRSALLQRDRGYLLDATTVTLNGV